MAQNTDKPVDDTKDVPLNNKTASQKLSKNEKDEVSEEDQKIIDELEMLVERLSEPDKKLYKPTLELLRSMIRSSSGTMTSVPKPLKYLKPHYNTLETIYSQWPIDEEKNMLADILSLLGMAYDTEGKRDCLKYCIEAGIKEENIVEWGHEYIRHLAMELGDLEDEGGNTMFDPKYTQQLCMSIVKYFFEHNAESDAIDLLQQTNSIERIFEVVDKNTYERACRYLVACSALIAPPLNKTFLEISRKIYSTFGSPAQCLEISLKLGRPDLIKEDFSKANTRLEKIQLAFMLSYQQVYIPELAEGDELILESMQNTKLSERFLEMAEQLSLMDPKVPEDIYKTNIEGSRFGGQAVDSAKHNLASTFVNAFVNAGFGTDKLMTAGDDGNAWVYKNRDTGMLSASASLGMIMLWDVEKGLGFIDKYLYASETYIKAGAVLGIGMMTAGVTDDTDTAKALLSEYLEDAHQSADLKLAAIQGMGLSYAGSNREDIADLLIPFICDTELSMELASMAALSAGLVCIGSCNGDVASSILQAIMERSESELDKPYAQFMAFGLALLYFGHGEESEATLETLKAMDSHPIGEQASVLVEICSYAGSGDVLKIQRLLEICGAHSTNPEDSEVPKNDDSDSNMDDGESTSPANKGLDQMYAVLGIAMIAMGEPVGSEMALRSFTHIMHYGDAAVKKAVPLAIGLLMASNPDVPILETLSKYSHDMDAEIAANAILAMGYVGAGTNNARLAQMLRQLASYYYKSPGCLFMVRIAQGLLHMAKGTMTLSPLRFDRSVLSPLSLASLLIPVIANCIPKQQLLLGSSHYLLYYLVRAMSPRHMITLVLTPESEEGDQKLVSAAVNVRVGQSVDSVGQAGKPKTITGFQTHTTPVLLANGERAELATEEYIPLASTLEGFVILTKNPEFES
ncbi:hypothetical protein BB559_000008 [Furculomyces boomerangus]|uniref:26S proteasome regulatory subunit RPN1 n=2 Tax=Harpellales TaxID=61421 RepID=A0A2T9Z6L1_9FUNG|nr:hypothetical protein BB559_000008 [Furculomyces boomerangus]PVZ99368.1 hypothetical protein BB558_004607 [Smittium angustum]